MEAKSLEAMDEARDEIVIEYHNYTYQVVIEKTLGLFTQTVFYDAEVKLFCFDGTENDPKTLRRMIHAYFVGHDTGQRHGRIDKAHEIRKALGL